MSENTQSVGFPITNKGIQGMQRVDVHKMYLYWKASPLGMVTTLSTMCVSFWKAFLGPMSWLLGLTEANHEGEQGLRNNSPTLKE